ncbi:DUF2892 domain-containing protein [Planococcus sp. CP5-4]|uniref:DUF2892 domain-containing protein n=1 Tax=unclassified Planococcus (in: firmicutes) TaxID=2662419 RepID=UPI001C212D64|nr:MULTISPECIES: DUF2892 domain-containing protein [unclassified Planococcus (in: firmicutes)]MBU9674396.1 DUF2892 domain-containing protein [Planococcus sp. CP5-4_YE]MBV0909016.1 DUF2892 domain-containing protein [Planococcus sp. CP5-4_UN]MBW6065088.1 DUF2892 domain-containing protein [Planococcus sp. CP5-4]
MELDLAKEQLPSTQSKVNDHTPDHINQQIERETEASVNYYKRQDKNEIQTRIKELDHEWDTERLLKVNMASIAAISAVLAVRANRKWALLAGASSAVIIQHALQGWTPPIVLFRQMGIRTVDEINREKKALQNLLKKPE